MVFSRLELFLVVVLRRDHAWLLLVLVDLIYYDLCTLVSFVYC